MTNDKIDIDSLTYIVENYYTLREHWKKYKITTKTKIDFIDYSLIEYENGKKKEKNTDGL